MLNQVHHNFKIIDLCTSYHYFTMVHAVRIHSTVILLHWLVCAKSTAKAKSSALQTSLLTLAMSSAVLLATAMYEFPASLCGFW